MTKKTVMCGGCLRLTNFYEDGANTPVKLLCIHCKKTYILLMRNGESAGSCRLDFTSNSDRFRIMWVADREIRAIAHANKKAVPSGRLEDLLTMLQLHYRNMKKLDK